MLLIEDNDPPFWLEEPLEQIFTDNIDGEVFDVPVADDVCSNFEVDMTTTYNDGLCPLSVVMTRTFVATDQCGNTSAPFIQTITEETDLEASLSSVTAVSCHDGNDGTADLSYSGGVAPYTVDWNGYNPSSLPAGEYTVEVLDANLCSVTLDFLVTQPALFSLDRRPTFLNAVTLRAAPLPQTSTEGLETSASNGTASTPTPLPLERTRLWPQMRQGALLALW